MSSYLRKKLIQVHSKAEFLSDQRNESRQEGEREGEIGFVPLSLFLSFLSFFFILVSNGLALRTFL
jgi:hypothetical protein